MEVKDKNGVPLTIGDTVLYEHFEEVTQRTNVQSGRISGIRVLIGGEPVDPATVTKATSGGTRRRSRGTRRRRR